MALLWRRKKRSHRSCFHQVQASPEALQEATTMPEIKGSSSHAPLPSAPEGEKDELVVSSEANDSKGLCQVCQKEKIAARRYRIKLIVGLFFPFALQALDVTIIASALPWIASDFHEISQMNWIISAFNLTSAAFIPFWGQMADIFGRLNAMEAALVLVMVGSALCTSAPTNAFPILILGRAIQGIGCAGIQVVNKVILADKVSLKEYSKNVSIFSFFAGLSYALGPLIGGFLTNKTWRWCFGINLPVAVISVVLFFLILRPELLGPQPLPELLAASDGNEQQQSIRTFKARLLTIDFGGQLLFLFGMGFLILALTWGGATYSWNSVHVVLPLVLGATFTLCFVWWQYMMVPGRIISRKFLLQRPTIPWSLLAQRNMGLLFYINLATGMAMTAVLYYVDIYLVLFKAFTPSQAGIQLLYYTPGIGIGVYVAMYMCNFYPAQTFHPLFLGSLIEATGLSILTWALHSGHTATIYGMMGLTGCGTGMRFMPGSLHGIGFFPNNIAPIISMMSFAVPFGSTICMTLMGTVFNNKSGMSKSGSGREIGGLGNFPRVVEEKIREDARTGIVFAFIAILPLMWLCVLLAGLLGNVRITKDGQVDEKGNRDFSENVTEGVYLVGLIRMILGRGKNVAVPPNNEHDEVKEDEPAKAEASVADHEVA